MYIIIEQIKKRESQESSRCTLTSRMRLIQLHCGDIGALVGFKDIKTGDTLCDEKNKIVLESMVFPDPVIGYAIEPKTQSDVDKLGMAIAKLVEEDPTLTVNTDEETGQTYLEVWVSFILILSWIV